MGLFSRKSKVVKDIYGGAWGHLVTEHKIDVDALSKDMRCVDKPGMVDGHIPVTFLRVFRLSDVAKRELTVTGWETLDRYPDLILFEGYLDNKNTAHLERKKP
jgi:hypothetical protein